ncbi:XK-related protein 6 [Penaeus vannamei]|uniref:XK-related protein n=1 Tax=Penaeus vannamei TaxID=6689 RepID=A0A3R7PHY8_PENVA|nr:XK-related protein 6 [Penaeus vannamei]
MAGSSDEGDTRGDYFRPLPRTDGRTVTPKMPTFTYFDAGFLLVSMATFAVDVGTDLNLVIRYFLEGSVIWAGLTLALVLVPAVVVMIMSMKWHYVEAEAEAEYAANEAEQTSDSEKKPVKTPSVSKLCWLAHICLWGILHRYILLFKSGIRAQRTKDTEDFRDMYRQQSDVCMLRLFESFLESAPQLVLQLYIMMSHHDYSAWTAITALSSMASLGWGIAAYTKAMRNTLPAKHKMTVSGLVLQTFWRMGMIAARVAALALVATVLNEWLLVIMGAHLLVMFIWVVKQKAEYGVSTLEKMIFNFIMAVICCFCFFNLKDGRSRWRMLAFYTVTVAENTAFTLYYFFMSDHQQVLRLAALGLVFGGMALGLLCLVIYYRFFHPIGPIRMFIKDEPGELEKGGKEADNSHTLDSNANSTFRESTRRNIKYMYATATQKTVKCILSAPGVSLESSPASSASQSSASPPLVSHMQRPVEMMCSVQDLLANVSCTSEMQVAEVVEEGTSQSQSEVPEEKKNSEESPVVVEASPSSLERTVTRELEYRLSQSDFRSLCSAGEQSPGTTETSLPQESNQLCIKSVNSGAAIGESVHSSPNSVGIPQKSKTTSQTSVRSGLLSGSQHSGSSILRTSVRKRDATNSETDVRLTSLPHITTSTINLTSKSQEMELDHSEAQLSKAPVPNVELAVIDRMHIIEMESSGTSSENQSDYENIYEGQDARRNLPPKPANLVIAQNLNETQSTQASVPHDYENICAVNINRAMWGLRHWKTYSDIEDRIHDDNEAKDDSRLMAVLNQLRANKAMNKSSSVDNIPNYETIWVGDVAKPDTSNTSSQMSSLTSKSSLVVTIGDVRAKESLCNLYYSTMSDLSFRYYSERMRKNSSSGSLASKRSTRDTSREMMRAISVPDNKTLLEVSQLIEEQKKREEEEAKQTSNQGGATAATPCTPRPLKFGPGATPVRSDPSNNRPRRKFSMLRERFENPNWTPLRSPMKRGPSTQRRNSFQDRTAKALQAGMKVFRRPRVHVITPKKGEDKMDTPRLKSPFKSRNVTPSNTLGLKTGPEPLSTETALKTRLLESEGATAIHKTPHIKTPADNRLTKRTPKTSTPENKQPLVKKTPVPIKGAKKLTEGPKTSTPEGNKQLPQISILSAVSSVVPSPESVLKFNLSDHQQRIPLSENVHQIRTSSKSLAMPAIKEAEYIPSVLLPKPFYGSLQSGVAHGSQGLALKPTRIITSDENSQDIRSRPSSSGLASSQSVLSLKAKQASPLADGGSRLNQNQAMFSGILGLPPYQQEPCRPAIISVTESTENPSGQQNISISRIVLSSPQSPNFNMQKSTLSPTSKIFSRRI